MNVLTSFYYTKDAKLLEALSEAGASVLLDSGAYSQYAALERGDHTKEEVIESLSCYRDSYVSLLEDCENCLDGYFNLDLIGDRQISSEYQSSIEGEGFEPIPVYHGPAKDGDAISEFCEGYEYVAVPADSKYQSVTTTSWYDKKRLAFFLRNSGDCNVHFLGASDKRVVKALNPYSSDSANHLDFWQPRSRIKVFRETDKSWHRLSRNQEDWSNLEALNAFLDILGFSRLDELRVDIENEKYDFPLEQIAAYAGWFNFTKFIDRQGFTKMYAAVKNLKQLAAIAYVGKRTGWLSEGFYQWMIER